jgi:excisionase family DNA binding protein
MVDAVRLKVWKGVIALTNADDLLDANEVAQMLGVSDWTVRQLAKQGELATTPAMRGQRRLVRFTRAAVDAYKAKQAERLGPGADG